MIPNNRRILHFALIALFLLLSVSFQLVTVSAFGSGSSSSVIAESLERPASSYDTNRDLLIVGQFSTKKTHLFDKDDQEIGMIPALAGDYAADAQGTLYDVPYGNTNYLMIFDPPYHKEAAQIVFRGYVTDTVAVDLDLTRFDRRVV